LDRPFHPGFGLVIDVFEHIGLHLTGGISERNL
jgi:hypothetical protein